MKMQAGRSKPYTTEGIHHADCVRCGKPAVHQWHACADGKWRPICRECDIALNQLALEFMFPDDPDGNKEKIKQYREQYNA